jgi:predicted patatin/cPLA2 family phospholipase
MKEVKTALVVEGGAMRGIFASGVLDAFIEQNFNPFNFVIGVSAGSINAAAYITEQKKRNLKLFTTYSLDPKYISWKRFLFGGHLIDLDWIWDVSLSNLPIHVDILFGKPIEYEIGLTSAETGKAFFVQPNAENLSHVMKASCTMPLFYRNYLQVENQVVADGGVSAPIPIERAIEKGAKKIIVVRSLKASYRMKNGKENKWASFLFRKYPALADAICNRPEIYNHSLDLIKNPPAGIEIIDVCPPEEFQTTRFTQDYDILMKDYQIGKDLGLKAVNTWNRL